MDDESLDGDAPEPRGSVHNVGARQVEAWDLSQAEAGHGLRLSPQLRARTEFLYPTGLNGKKILAAAEAIRPDTHVFLCGPISMVTDITRDLRRQNIPTDYIHAEHFSFR